MFRRAFDRGRRHVQHLLRLEQLTRSICGTSAPCLLDFGCGFGDFIEMASQFGFEATARNPRGDGSARARRPERAHELRAATTVGPAGVGRWRATAGCYASRVRPWLPRLRLGEVLPPEKLNLVGQIRTRTK
jgi:hypothetical protein